jgi:Carboxypeptidase regulatory-like domain
MQIRMVVFLLLTSLSAFAQGSQTGTITGRVVNESGQPLPNARVSVLAVGSLQRTVGTTTDREGKFQVSGLEPRSYRVFAFLSTYTPLASDFETWSRSYRLGDSVTLVLTKGGVITGTVTSQTGEPVVGVRVFARMLRNESSQLPFPFRYYPLERMTDDRGIYRIYGLPAGTYIVWAGGSGGTITDLDAFNADAPTYSPSSTRDTAEEITVHAGEERTNVDIRYRGEPGHIVSGSARGSDSSEATTGYGINLTAIGSKVESSMVTGQEPGRKGFVFRGVEDGDYEVTAFSAVENQLTGMASKRIKVRGADITGIELVTQPLASVSGRVVLEESKATECAGKQRLLLAETSVSASADESQSIDLHPQLGWMLGRVPVNPDAQGNVSFKNLIPGRYYFVPQFAGKYWYVQSVTVSNKTAPVDAARNWTTLKAGDRLSGLTITLAQGAASLQGQLALNEGETQPEGTFVYLVPAEHEKASDVLRFFAAGVNADGKVAINNIAPGRYWMLVKSDTAAASVTKLRSPDQADFRAKLRQDAEAAKKEIELKPCQNVDGFQIPLKVSGSVP